MNALAAYNELVARINLRCHDILGRYADRIACSKGCKGNCCRIHLSVSAIEAFHIAGVLKKQTPAKIDQIRIRAYQSPASGPCPLLDEGACGMYSDRFILCRTHGLPMRSRYRSSVSIGCCPKNFQKPAVIPDDACINLDQLNSRLATIGRQFLSEYSGRLNLKERYPIGQALLLEF